VEPAGGGNVHVPVAVVHPVEAPQERDGVVGAMPNVHPAIEKHQRKHEAERPGEADAVQQAKLGSSIC
jgi:hypothetical protein